MKKLYWIISSSVVFLLVAMSCELDAQQRYHQSELNLSEIKETLYSLEKGGEAEIELPNHVGNLRNYTLRESGILDASVADRRTDYRTFSIVDRSNAQIRGRMAISQFGIQASILTPFGTIFIEPDGLLDSEYYFIYLNDNPLAESRASEARPSCMGAEKSPDYQPPVRRFNLRENDILEFGDVTRTYNVAIVTTGDFYVNNGSSVSMAETVVFNSMNGIQAIFEVDMGVKFNVLSPHIYTNPNTHPFTGDNPPKEAADAVALHFSTNSYDIGHVFHNSTDSDLDVSGGVAGLGVVCQNFPWAGGPGVAKAAGWSGAGTNTTNGWIRLAAHEIGHMFDATHTFNGMGDNCDSDNFEPSTNYEIGSGTTVMSYQGICGSGQNIPSSGVADNYFHANSLEQMINYILNTATCASTSAPVNTPPTAIADPCGGSYSIPLGTPFYLTGEAEDPDGDLLTYTWEQFDNDGPSGPTYGKIGTSAAADPVAPLFRSYPPSTSPTRSFPSMNLLLDANLSSSFEPLPTVERDLTFRLTVRDQQGGVGIDEMSMSVTGDGPFELTSPNGGEVLSAGTSTTINWSVNGTDALCDDLTISLSIDGGTTFPFTLAEGVSNSGSYNLDIPAGIPITQQARMKIACADNPCVVFFAISDGDFEVDSDCTVFPSNICPLNEISGDAGESVFNLDLNYFPGNYIESRTFSTSSGAPQYIITTDDGSGGCLGWPGEAAYDIMEFSVTSSGEYSFTIDGFGGSGDFRVSNIFEGSFDPQNTCNTWVASNTFDTGGGNVNGSGTYFVELESCNTYFITVARFFGADPFNNSVSISGPGEVIEVESLGSDNAYTYVAVNQNTDLVAAVSSDADFTSLGGGDFCVWGVMYKESGSTPPSNLSPNDFIGQSLSGLLGSGNCLLISYECKPLSITGSDECIATFSYQGTSSSESEPFNSIQFCSGDSNPTPTVSGNPGGTFSADSGDLTIDPATGQIDISNSAVGTYLVTYTDDTEDGCEESIEVVIAESPEAEADNDGPVCEGGDITLAASGGISYSWSGPNGFSSDEQNPSLEEVSAEAAGSYTVIATAENGCTAEAETVVEIYSLPEAEAANDGPYCEGDEIQLTAEGGTAYSWSGPDGFSSDEQNPVITDATQGQSGEYTVEVTDQNGCLASAVTSVTVRENPTASADNDGPVCEGGELQLTADGGTEYSWSGPNGFSSDEQNPLLSEVNTDQSGEYTVEVTDENGCSATANTEVTVHQNPIAVADNSGPYCIGQTIELTAEGGVEYQWEGPDNFTSVIQSPDFPNALQLNGGVYSVTVTDENGCSSVTTTTVVVEECFIITGDISWEGDGSGVNLTEVVIDGEITDSRITNLDGTYSFQLTDGGDYTLTPSRENDRMNGVEVGDALIIRQHLAGVLDITSPYKLIAADINRDDTIDEEDIVAAISNILGVPGAEDQFPNSWRFADADYDFPEPHTPWGFPEFISLEDVEEDVFSQNFIGIKVGDINATANPADVEAVIPDLDENDNLLWRVLESDWMEEDQIVDLVFTSGQFNGFAAYQFGLSFDTDQLEFVEAIPGGELGLSALNFGDAGAENGALRMAWVNTGGEDAALAEGTETFTLRFRSLSAEGMASEHLTLDNDVLLGMAYNADLLRSTVDMEFFDDDTVSTHDHGALADFILKQNRPNPFSQHTTIDFTLPQSGQATIRIIDISGREIHKVEGFFHKGENELLLEYNFSPGLYFYELSTPYGTRIKRMMAQ